jgi:hypothetical protein
LRVVAGHVGEQVRLTPTAARPCTALTASKASRPLEPVVTLVWYTLPRTDWSYAAVTTVVGSRTTTARGPDCGESIHMPRSTRPLLSRSTTAW